MLERKEIVELSFPVEIYNYYVATWRSVDGGASWWYCGNSKYFRTLAEAKAYAEK